MIHVYKEKYLPEIRFKLCEPDTNGYTWSDPYVEIYTTGYYNHFRIEIIGGKIRWTKIFHIEGGVFVKCSAPSWSRRKKLRRFVEQIWNMRNFT